MLVDIIYRGFVDNCIFYTHFKCLLSVVNSIEWSRILEAITVRFWITTFTASSLSLWSWSSHKRSTCTLIKFETHTFTGSLYCKVRTAAGSYLQCVSHASPLWGPYNEVRGPFASLQNKPFYKMLPSFSIDKAFHLRNSPWIRNCSRLALGLIKSSVQL